PVRPEVIANGLDVDAYDGPRLRDGRTLLFLGRIDERRKGLQQLLDAWPALRERRPSARLLVAGPGRAPAVPRNVQVLGEVTEDAKRQLLRDADLVVAPNTHGESFGLVLVEAMAAGTPVLANALPAFADVLGGGRFGTLYDGDLVRAAAELLSDPVRRDRLAAAARSEVGRYDWEVVAPSIEEVYLDLVDGAEATAV
ncbi:MAG TPA: glycosyltransferase family 4 protein, partial [Nocardioidaceae bacterium]|nr:glycosyltransferase family 4 protein [Nocardioidaceae bacterium]